MLSLKPYQLPMGDVPDCVNDVRARGVESADFPMRNNAAQVFAQWDTYANRVLRASDGRVLVTCTTPMPAVSATMIEWWFSWHILASERYRLWHPEAHKRARVKENRAHLSEITAQYIGNVSYVDELIGKRMMRLAIAFVAPESMGLSVARDKGETAICAATSDRLLRSDAGVLVHYIVPTEAGCEMRSVFWLGDLSLRVPVVGALVSPIINQRLSRQLLVGDGLALDLFQHCAEEMTHLARFLPELYRKQHK